MIHLSFVVPAGFVLFTLPWLFDRYASPNFPDWLIWTITIAVAFVAGVLGLGVFQ